MADRELTAQESLLNVALAIVVAHVAVNVIHGLAHGAVEVWLPAWKNVVVLLMILIGPPVGLALAWRGHAAAGYGLLTLTMAGSLAFGVWHHFIAMSPDHVSQIPDGAWGAAFIASSWALALSELAGAAIGVVGWRRARAAGEPKPG